MNDSMTEFNSVENCVQLCRKISKLSQDNVWDNFETTDAQTCKQILEKTWRKLCAIV